MRLTPSVRAVPGVVRFGFEQPPVGFGGRESHGQMQASILPVGLAELVLDFVGSGVYDKAKTRADEHQRLEDSASKRDSQVFRNGVAGVMFVKLLSVPTGGGPAQIEMAHAIPA